MMGYGYDGGRGFDPYLDGIAFDDPRGGYQYQDDSAARAAESRADYAERENSSLRSEIAERDRELANMEYARQEGENERANLWDAVHEIRDSLASMQKRVVSAEKAANAERRRSDVLMRAVRRIVKRPTTEQYTQLGKKLRERLPQTKRDREALAFLQQMLRAYAIYYPSKDIEPEYRQKAINAEKSVNPGFVPEDAEQFLKRNQSWIEQYHENDMVLNSLNPRRIVTELRKPGFEKAGQIIRSCIASKSPLLTSYARRALTIIARHINLLEGRDHSREYTALSPKDPRMEKLELPRIPQLIYVKSQSSIEAELRNESVEEYKAREEGLDGLDDVDVISPQ